MRPLALGLASLLGCAHAAARVTPSPLEARIESERARVTKEPRQWPLWAELARDCLAQARATHDPVWLAQSREAAARSLSIQESFEAYSAMADLQNYTHRFEDALRWAALALEASNNGRAMPDPEIVSKLVEANLGLGRLDDAQKLLAPLDHETPYFYMAAAQGQWLLAGGRYEEASARFLRASRIAAGEHVAQLESWGVVAAAGALLDGGMAEKARPLLEDAAHRFPPGAFLYIHQAELAALEKRPADEVDLYEKALALDPDPEMERLAFTAAHKLGDAARAQLHFQRAEAGLRRALDAGEVFPLGALAQLYADAGVHLEEARALAQRNLEFKRDRAALRTWAALHGGALPTPPG